MATPKLLEALPCYEALYEANKSSSEYRYAYVRMLTGLSRNDAAYAIARKHLRDPLMRHLLYMGRPKVLQDTSVEDILVRRCDFKDKPLDIWVIVDGQSDYYNYQYRDAGETHDAYWALGPTKKRAAVYVQKESDAAKSLRDATAKRKKATFPPLYARLRVVVDGDRAKTTAAACSQSNSLIEVLKVLELSPGT